MTVNFRSSSSFLSCLHQHSLLSRTFTFFSIMVHYLWVLVPLSVILGASALPSSTAEQSESSSLLSASVPSDALISSNAAASSCANSPSDRSCWGDFDISTNYYDFVPDTGVTREYWFNIENTTAAPDGIERIVLAVNGSIPGPTIIADWGDEVIIHVTNSMTNNGSTIHWHGIRQNFTNVSLQSPFVLSVRWLSLCVATSLISSPTTVHGRCTFSHAMPHCSWGYTDL